MSQPKTHPNYPTTRKLASSRRTGRKPTMINPIVVRFTLPEKDLLQLKLKYGRQWQQIVRKLISQYIKT